MPNTQSVYFGISSEPGFDNGIRPSCAINANNIAIEIHEGEARLGYPKLVHSRVTLPSDRSFGSYEEALAHLKGPRLPDSMELFWNQQLLDVLFEYPIRSERSDFSIRPGLERLGLRVTIVLRFLPPGGAVRAFEYHGDPGLVRLDPRWHQAALQFVKLGFIHILEGADHLLFLLCLVIPLRRLWPLVVGQNVSSYTIQVVLSQFLNAQVLNLHELFIGAIISTLPIIMLFLVLQRYYIAGLMVGSVKG